MGRTERYAAAASFTVAELSTTASDNPLRYAVASSNASAASNAAMRRLHQPTAPEPVAPP
ncbi:MAG: hypothetical protein IPF40_00005 [Actinomycetales bacterium]|uniref:Uncharacterized protein n=1 Tax=Candidatus Phosphoribacter hodrii TaxID=2953743 RepID=A0A935CE05_9MICO|nr:hypothetical protein [Candidatus Phosphoribacter hodrii]